MTTMRVAQIPSPKRPFEMVERPIPQPTYDAPSDTFKPFGEDESFGTKVCYKCHTAAKATDYIFTSYPGRR